MPPLSNTAYTIALFLSLAALRQWTVRRHRVPRAYRNAVLGAGTNS